MTRVTAPISKLTHSLASRPTVARPAYIAASHGGKAASSPRLQLELNVEGRSSDSVDSHRSMTTTHRPTPAPTPSPYRTIPLMQSFRTSAPSPVSMDTRTIDAAVLPASLFAPVPGADALAPGVGRIPLLPDHFSPDRAALASAGLAAPEVPDAPLAAPQVLVVAAHPENVTPSVLTEVEGMGVDGVELKFAHDPLGAAGRDEDGRGMLRDMWRGLVDDVFGESGTKVAALRS